MRKNSAIIEVNYVFKSHSTHVALLCDMPLKKFAKYIDVASTSENDTHHLVHYVNEFYQDNHAHWPLIPADDIIV